ncbi:MAG: DUF4157 domain-containing protein, partial [Chloroflexi bacterium]|nr:DUF4157 domain-containing protein [Chloroflexota bacterium]
MTSSKTFQHRSPTRSSEETDRVLSGEAIESNETCAPASFEWAYTPQLIRADALRQHPIAREPRAQLALGLQQQVGNQAVQRLVAQRQVAPRSGAFEVDDETQARIQRERGGGQALDPVTRDTMSRSIGYDFGGVRIHASAEADDLSHDLKALAFTIGNDVFFRAGQYDPASASGQELIAHELAHVVQQGSRSIGTADRMTVNAPGDANEQAADAVAQSVMSQSTANVPAVASAPVQRETPEEELILPKAEPGAWVQRETPEEELILPKAEPGAWVQRETPEEEEILPKAEPGAWVQRQAEDEREPVAPVPDVAGQGEVFQDVAFARAAPNLQGRTNATFRNSFHTEGLTTEAGEGCRGCRPRDCVHVTGSLVSEFTATTRVTLPRVPRGYSACEREQIQ